MRLHPIKRNITHTHPTDKAKLQSSRNKYLTRKRSNAHRTHTYAPVTSHEYASHGTFILCISLQITQFRKSFLLVFETTPYRSFAPSLLTFSYFCSLWSRIFWFTSTAQFARFQFNINLTLLTAHFGGCKSFNISDPLVACLSFSSSFFRMCAHRKSFWLWLEAEKKKYTDALCSIDRFVDDEIKRRNQTTTLQHQKCMEQHHLL